MKTSKKKYLLIFIFISFQLGLKAQQATPYTQNMPQNMPQSIYTLHCFKAITQPQLQFNNLSQQPTLTPYNFVFLENKNQFFKINSMDVDCIGEQTSFLDIEDYKRFQDRNLLEKRLRDHDPTQWNLQCLNNRTQPSLMR